MDDPLARLARALEAAQARYVVIGVWGANYWARTVGELFTTLDQDLFVPPDPDNLLRCWAACESTGLELQSNREELDRPRDRWLAEQVIARRALTTAVGTGVRADFTLVMGTFDFETVWAARTLFAVDGVSIPVARLLHIVAAKQAAGREKDRLFLATHKDALEQLRRRVDPGTRAAE